MNQTVTHQKSTTWKPVDVAMPRDGVITSIYRRGRYTAHVTECRVAWGERLGVSVFIRRKGMQVCLGSEDGGTTVEEALAIAEALVAQREEKGDTR